MNTRQMPDPARDVEVAGRIVGGNTDPDAQQAVALALARLAHPGNLPAQTEQLTADPGTLHSMTRHENEPTR